MKWLKENKEYPVIKRYDVKYAIDKVFITSATVSWLLDYRANTISKIKENGMIIYGKQCKSKSLFSSSRSV